MPRIEKGTTTTRKRHGSDLKALCKNVVATLSAERQITGCLCFGSRAIGCHCETSDVDLFVFCDGEVLSASRRRRAYRRLGPQVQIEIDERAPDEREGWATTNDTVIVGGMRYDFTYNTIQWITSIVDQVLESGALSVPELPSRCYTMLGLLTHSVILYERNHALTSLVARMYPFPAKLKAALIAKSTTALRELSEDLATCDMRSLGNVVYLYYVSQVFDEIEDLMFALNEVYNPASKHTEHLLSQLKVTPPEFFARFQSVVRRLLPPDRRRETTRGVRSLAEDAVRLADRS